MAEYLAPAVYVEEVSFRAKSVAGVGTSTCGFVGMATRGPVGITPPLLTSFADFERYYGGLDDLSVGGNRMINFLAHGARAFFANGGGRLYVTRILGAGGTVASGVVNPKDAADSQVTLTTRTAGGASVPGKAGTNYLVTLTVDSLSTTKALAMKQAPGTVVLVPDADPKKPAHAFILASPPIAATDGDKALDTAKDTDPVTIQTLSVLVTGPEGPVAEYSGLGFHSSHPRPALTVLGATPPSAIDGLTNPVMLSVGAKVTAFSLNAAIAALVPPVPPTGGSNGPLPVALTGGTDGAAPADTDWDAALNLLLGLEDISIIAAPGSSAFTGTTPASVVQKLIGSAETRRAYRIAVLDTPQGLEPTGSPSAVSVKNGIDSTHAALYYPWVMVANPLSATDPRQPDQIALPPSGFVCGIYARSDINRGVIKAPANETVTGALGLQRDVRFGEQEVLNPLGVNCIRALPNRGIRVWGARTISSDPEWMYVNIRRYFLYLEASIDRGTQWAVFEPNGERLWANVRTTISDFLYNEWVNGALLGSKPEDAFFVNCDRSTMTQNDLDNGRLVCLVGVAALKPAEFVIFRIGQKTADARN